MTEKLESGEMWKFLFYGAVGGFISGIVFSVVIFMGGLFPWIGQLLGFADPMDFLIGVIMYFIFSIIVGLIYGVIILFLKYINWDISNWVKNIILGLIYGLIVWILDALIGMQILMDLVGMTTVNNPLLILRSPFGLVGYLIFGAIIAAVAWFLNERMK
ncbi:MAG: hypothetical protein ACFFCZ_18690 [Promethearchaeota archaeon]